MNKIISIFLLTFSFLYAQQTVGLIKNDPGAYQGYTLFAPLSGTTTYLIDMNGLLIHKWEHPFEPEQAVYLLENGNILRASIITDPNGGNGGFQEIDWDGNIVWEYIFGRQHHDVEPLPNGNVLMVTNDVRTRAQCLAGGRNPDLLGNNLRLLRIIEVGRDSSDIVWEWYSWDHLVQEFDETKSNFGVVADHPELMDFNFTYNSEADWLHTNAIDYNTELDQIIVTNRGTNEIWIIDHSTTTEEAAGHTGGNSGKGGDFLYRWGNPATYQAGTVEDQKLFAQHDAHWIEPGKPGEGNILIFNNGLGRPDGAYSSIVEITPPLSGVNYVMQGDSLFGPDTLTWVYIAEPDSSFTDGRFGGVQRLQNGNTLITSPLSGRFFEVTPEGETVWEYINPVNSGQPVMQGTIVDDNFVGRSYRYPLDYPAFTGKELTPGDPIELPGASSIEDRQNISKDFQLLGNYPNPFNPTTTINYKLNISSKVNLSIYDVLGHKVRTLINQKQTTGNKKVLWDGRNDSGQQLTSGLYFYKLQAGNHSAWQKMILIK